MGYRWVQEVEIGSALAYASTDMYCNPKYFEELPALAMMLTLASVQVPFSQVVGSAASTQSFVRPTTSRAASYVGDTKESPLFLDEAEETTAGSFDLSQLVAPPRRPVRKDPLFVGQTASSRPPPPPLQYTKASAVEKPVKKKAKTDRMALFFDGLDDEDDVIEVDSHNNPNSPPAQALPIPMGKATRLSSSLQAPVPVAWPDPDDIDLQQDAPSQRATHQSSPKKDQIKASSSASEASKSTSATTTNIKSAGKDKAKSRLMNAMFEDDEDDEVGETRFDTVKGSETSRQDDAETTAASDKKSDDKLKDMEKLFLYSVKESDTLSQLSAPTTRGAAGKKKKPTSFDVIRDDMVALNLDVKLERQIQNMEEQERWKRLPPQTKGDSNKVMQWERSAALNTKSKRRKMVEQQDQRGQGSKSMESRTGSPHGSDDDVQILDEAEQKDWPERWKTMPNFKNFSGPSLTLQEKWKNVPNFKAFRKVRVMLLVDFRPLTGQTCGG